MLKMSFPFKNVAIIFGTRPEAIKLFILYRDLKTYCNCKLVFTGQHPDMIQDILDLFEIDDCIFLEKPCSSSLSHLSSDILKSCDEYFRKEITDLVVVQGDTASAYFSALAAFHRHIPIAHVEAGLRSGNNHEPWPEEVYRKALSQISTFHFAPTLLAKKALLNEKFNPKSMWVTGNSVIDALCFVLEKIKASQHLISPLKSNLKKKNLDIQKPFFLITFHRRENWHEPLSNFLKSLVVIQRHFPDHFFVWPLHPNQDLQAKIKSYLSKHERFIFLAPQPYLSFVALMKASDLILSDSGGIQEEVTFLKKPMILLRNCSERPESFESGWVKASSTALNELLENINTHLNETHRLSDTPCPFGDGQASKKIIQALLSTTPQNV